MQKPKYVLEILVVVFMSFYFVLELILNGFAEVEYLTLITVILLSTTFYESYKKDKIIAKLQKNSKSEIKTI
ncbi:hypothetical protein [Campylobacter canadensis]|uniref:Small hydrophobic protein n=1 Tax=Campylobacter canadensis TaxID=449520 RepID=A0ABS7WSL8_9BACT|nr:hypothetical protein [Campylobacter canadensis]MBZ7987765.1 hypothetical protein [Campylobacter canadensis]MBZ7998562.1 hypothetical protein [Campylobacter canadensis]